MHLLKIPMEYVKFCLRMINIAWIRQKQAIAPILKTYGQVNQANANQGLKVNFEKKILWINIWNLIWDEKYSLKIMYIELWKLQLHISTLGMDARVAFPVADFIRIAFVLAPFRTANRNVIIATIVRAMLKWFRESIMGSVYWQLCLQYAQVDVLLSLIHIWRCRRRR